MSLKPRGELVLSGIDPKAFRCFHCCHVKTGTLIYGVFMAAVQIIFMGLLILATIRPEILKPDNQQPYDGIVVVQNDKGVFEDFAAAETAREERAAKDNLHLMYGVTLICMVSSIALVYGVGKNRASYVLPFFCLQVFDFCLTCLTVVVGFTKANNIRQWIHQQRLDNFPGMSHLMCLNSEILTLLFIMGLFLMLSLKAYLIGMVWACYKYIKLYVASRSVVVESAVDPDMEILMPPRYSDVVKVSPHYAAPPPAYTSE